MMAESSLAKALSALDKALADAPERNGHAFSEAMRCLTAYREEVIARHDHGTADGQRRLFHLNSILSMILAGHFPLGDPPWDEIRKARGDLADMAAEASPQSGKTDR